MTIYSTVLRLKALTGELINFKFAVFNIYKFNKTLTLDCFSLLFQLAPEDFPRNTMLLDVDRILAITNAG